MQTESLEKLTLNLLSEEEYKEAQAAGLIDDNQMYLTPDDIGNHLVLDDYATNERVTSKRWVDGRPIYRKVIEVGPLPNATYKTVNHGIQNFDLPTNIFVFAKRTTDGMILPIPYINTNASNPGAGYIFNAGMIQIFTNDDRTNCNGYAIVEYVKTTDVPVTTNPLQLPLYTQTNYTEDEQIVGTWVDGRNVYRKTFVEHLGTLRDKITAAALGYDVVVKLDGFVFSNYNQWWRLGNSYVESAYNTYYYWDATQIKIELGGHFDANALTILHVEYVKKEG